MQNGDSIVGEGLYNELTIVPDDSNQFYLFITCTVFPGSEGFYYCKIDMNLNGGLGAVTQKNIQLLNFEIADCVQAIKHGNGRDWWVLAKLSGPGNTQINRFFVYLISPNGISNPIIQDFGNVTDGDFEKIVFNNQKNKFMLINFIGFMGDYDFDRCTGIISNPSIIFPELSSNYNRFFWEGAYSPNDSLFYATTTWNTFPQDTSRLLQFNLFSANIPASCDTLFESRNPKNFGAVRLAPDNKIYMTSFYNWGFPGYPYPDSVRNVYNENLSVINYPDSLGTACNFQPYSFYLGGKRTYFGLPNNPNYGLGRWISSPCDTLNVSVGELEVNNKWELFVFYHSSWEMLFINAQNIKGRNCLLQIFDINGREVFSSAKNTQPPYFTQDVDVVSLSSGMYVVALTTEKEKLVKKFIKQ